MNEDSDSLPIISKEFYNLETENAYNIADLKNTFILNLKLINNNEIKNINSSSTIIIGKNYYFKAKALFENFDINKVIPQSCSIKDKLKAETRLTDPKLFIVCNIGEELKIDRCEKCLLNTYQSYPNSFGDTCNLCPSDLPDTFNKGSISISDCQAEVGFFKFYDENQLKYTSSQCLPGMDCSVGGKTLEDIGVLDGSWRASNKSKIILSCSPHEDYCVGNSNKNYGDNVWNNIALCKIKYIYNLFNLNLFFFN